MKNRVVIVIPYFGKWPEWIDLYFYSCGRNPEIDFLFYTDCPVPEHHAENMTFRVCTFAEYCEQVSRELQMDFHPEKAYKLCDCKPYYGYIHRAELTEYDFLGFGDIDLVYGDLSMLINDDMLNRYDFITTHNTRVAGHLTIMRNNAEWREKCLTIKGWKEMMAMPDYQSLDETYFSGIVNPNEIWVSRLYRYCLRFFGVNYGRLLDKFNPWIAPRRSFVEYFTSPIPGEKNGQKEEWRYVLAENRILAPDGRELPYLHYLFFKKTPWHETEFYWRPGYWKLEGDFEKYKEIHFHWDEVVGI